MPPCPPTSTPLSPTLIPTCPFHPEHVGILDEVEKKVIAQEAYGKEHSRRLDDLFQLYGKMKETVDKNEGRAEGRDKKLEEISVISKSSLTKWTDVQGKMVLLQDSLENGINKRVDGVTESVTGKDGLIVQVKQLATSFLRMTNCIEQTKKEAEEKEKKEIQEAEEFSFWTKFGKSFARSVNKQWENVNWLFVIFFILWLIYGGDGNIMEHIHQTVDNIFGWKG